MKKYILTSTIYHAREEIVFYGIALIDENQGSYELIKEFNDLLEKKDEVQKLVDDCNELGIDESNLLNVVEELLNH